MDPGAPSRGGRRRRHRGDRPGPNPKEATIEPLTARQRAHLRSLAHHLKPILQIGKEGVTETATAAIVEAFNTRELLKVKVQESAPMSAAATGESLAARVDGAHLVQTIGRTVVLYRPHPTKPEVRLP